MAATLRSSSSSKGETRLGNVRGQGTVYVRSTKKSVGSVLAMDTVNAAGVRLTYYLFFSSDGKLRTHDTFPTNTETDGVVIGTQL